MVDSDFIEKLDDLVKEVKANGDVLTVSMRRLKDLYGGYRLKGLIRKSIADGLLYRQLGFVGIGDELPNSENDNVRLYLKGTPVGSIIEAVLLEGQPGDMRLREIAASNAALTTQDLVRRLNEVISQFDDSEKA